MTTPSESPESPASSMPPPPEDAPRPPYGYPPGHPPPYPYAYQRTPETNSMAIVALVMIFVFPPLAIIFGVIAKNQIDRTGEQGRGFAIAGIAAGSAMTALWVIGIVVYIWLFVTVFHEFGHYAVIQPN